MGRIPALLSVLVACFAGVCTARADEPKRVHFVVDTARDVRPISPYVYGTNAHDKAAASRPCNRLGGNRWTAYNWENNASNAGADWHHQSDGYLSDSDVPGAAVRGAVEAAAKSRQALIVTVPMAGYVSADKDGGGDVSKTPDYLGKRFHRSLPKKDGRLLLEPDLADRAVYQDEFVHWVEHTARQAAGADAQRPAIFYSLDNEPDLWAHTHARIHPDKVTYAELIDRTTRYASAINDICPDALVFGAVNYGWNGYRTLQDAPDAGGRDFHQVFLAAMKSAEQRHGGRLLDVLDVHWYPEARGGGVRVSEKDVSPDVVRARVRAPRSLWDPTYVESSWITESSTKGKPIELIPRLRRDVETHYPGTKIAITEYNYGGGDHISGGVAQADVLGIFGREGVFAANWWDLGHGSAYVHAAFDLYLNYDGRGARFGDTSVFASTDDVESTSIHASVNGSDRSAVMLVLINRSERPVAAEVALKNAEPLMRLSGARLTGDSPGVELIQARAIAGNRFAYTLPPMSATLLKPSK